MSGTKKMGKGEILFHEGDPSDAMYVVKSGRLAITKTKGSGEIVLAELKAGEMLGEMAFFDGKPRSAGAKAVTDVEVIALPFRALHAQFKTFPEWLKAMVKTVNSHLRDANTRIKNLEQATKADEIMFPPHMVTALCAVINFVSLKAGQETEEGLQIPAYQLRNYTIQIFQLPTNKLDRLIEVLSSMQVMSSEDLGEGRKKILLLKPDFLSKFVDWYNTYLFTEESKRVTIAENELPALRALIFYGSKVEKNEKGIVQVNLTDMQNNSMKDLGQLFNSGDADSLAAKGLTEEKQSGEGSILTMNFEIAPLEEALPFWELVYILAKVPAR